MNPWKWWTSPDQRYEQFYCHQGRNLSPTERARRAAARLRVQIGAGIEYGERSAENSNLSHRSDHLA